MADRITQLQDCYTQLQLQMFAALHYIQTRHPWALIPGQPDWSPENTHNMPSNESGPNTQNTQNTSTTSQPSQDDASKPKETPPDPPQIFHQRIKELAQDMVTKQKQIEFLIAALPSLETSEREQVERIRELDGQLEEMEGRKREAVEMKERLLERLDGRIIGMGAL
ncbi:hypothetical protein K402DRAFT_8042 [Aulographum hederae CBS 113979]|uniref:Mediator of RNA polymerase II transcription subunit 21 n=1 Tax=Aulographum hederae CBS 113979 TaxID=1176131 RepID=A0A6G1HH77_9PEZI|nr:hypothetical protein K402DRAFT_8042 [Aulographum hederae CBS 113979]